MPLKVAAIVKDAEDVNYVLAFAAEAQMIRSYAFLKVAFVLRAGTLHSELDIEKGLDAKGQPIPDPAKISAARWRAGSAESGRRRELAAAEFQPFDRAVLRQRVERV